MTRSLKSSLFRAVTCLIFSVNTISKAQYYDGHYSNGQTFQTKYENGQYTFICQHGDIECYGNKLHACAIDVIDSNSKAALFNICIMDRTFDYNTLNSLVEECGKRLQIPTGPIWECQRSERSSQLLKRYGEETHAVRPRYVPYVVLGGSAENQDVVTQYLGYSVCGLLTPRPYECGPV